MKVCIGYIILYYYRDIKAKKAFHSVAERKEIMANWKHIYGISNRGFAYHIGHTEIYPSTEELKLMHEL